MNPKELAELLDRLDSLSHDERVDLANRIQARYVELDVEDAPLEAVNEMVKLGHAASKLAPFLAGGRVAALGELVADGRPAGAVQRMARRQGKPTPSPEAQPEAGTGLLATMGPGVGKPVADQRALGQLVGEAALEPGAGECPSVRSRLSPPRSSPTRRSASSTSTRHALAS